ncbi:hypothetical protein FA95DRAFT_1554463 [Auriscalpium vulgare]|uniref:Uncharacterized protein n=1 Tax=Auriscalpium vulgare TaxID=40419 RepID=A0ACB8S667_9AGAM|nr:hypothetical protein FA95DRAFT_1554463 [Auriscalpium vulgare]
MPGPSGAPPYPVYAQGITFAQPAVDELRPQKRPRARPSSSSSSLTDVRRPSRDSLEPPTASSSAGEKKGKVKLPLSCGECRRLKLKCDRVFPCQSCVKRGCAEICPDGSLISGKGSRFILANTEQLHDKIVTMSERIRVLEEALNQAHISSSSSSQPHALLAPDLLSLKSSIELYGSAHSALSSADSSTRDSSDGPPTRPSTSSHTVQWSDEAASDSTDLSLSVNVLAQPLYPTARAPVPPSVPQDLAHLSACFPLPWTTPTGHADTRARIRDFLPPREEAHALCAEAQESAMWQHNPDPSESFLADLVEHAYTAPVEALSPHRLATVFMILAIGGTVDLRPGASTDAELYYHLARVAMCDYPLAGDANADSVTALVFMLWYLLVFNDRKGSVTMAWEIMGVAARTAQSTCIETALGGSFRRTRSSGAAPCSGSLSA